MTGGGRLCCGFASPERATKPASSSLFPHPLKTGSVQFGNDAPCRLAPGRRHSSCRERAPRAPGEGWRMSLSPSCLSTADTARADRLEWPDLGPLRWPYLAFAREELAAPSRACRLPHHRGRATGSTTAAASSSPTSSPVRGASPRETWTRSLRAPGATCRRAPVRRAASATSERRAGVPGDCRRASPGTSGVLGRRRRPLTGEAVHGVRGRIHRRGGRRARRLLPLAGLRGLPALHGRDRRGRRHRLLPPALDGARLRRGRSSGRATSSITSRTRGCAGRPTDGRETGEVDLREARRRRRRASTTRSSTTRRLGRRRGGSGDCLHARVHGDLRAFKDARGVRRRSRRPRRTTHVTDDVLCRRVSSGTNLPS